MDRVTHYIQGGFATHIEMFDCGEYQAHSKPKLASIIGGFRAVYLHDKRLRIRGATVAVHTTSTKPHQKV